MIKNGQTWFGLVLSPSPNSTLMFPRSTEPSVVSMGRFPDLHFEHRQDFHQNYVVNIHQQ